MLVSNPEFLLPLLGFARRRNLFLSGTVEPHGVAHIWSVVYPFELKGTRKSRQIALNLSIPIVLIIPRSARRWAIDWNLPQELAEVIGCHHNPDNIAQEFARLGSTIVCCRLRLPTKRPWVQ